MSSSTSSFFREYLILPVLSITEVVSAHASFGEELIDASPIYCSSRLSVSDDCFSFSSLNDSEAISVVATETTQMSDEVDNAFDPYD